MLRTGTEAEKGRGAEWRERSEGSSFWGSCKGEEWRSFQQAHLPGEAWSPLPRHAPSLAGAIYVLKAEPSPRKAWAQAGAEAGLWSAPPTSWLPAQAPRLSCPAIASEKTNRLVTITLLPAG